MKKILFIIIAVFITNNLNAISWSQMKSWTNKTVKPDVQYSIETERL